MSGRSGTSRTLCESRTLILWHSPDDDDAIRVKFLDMSGRPDRQLAWSVDVTAYGAKLDTVDLTDARVTVGSDIVTSPSGGFATAKAGQIISVETPQTLGPGTIATTASQPVIAGTGTQFSTLTNPHGIKIGNTEYALSWTSDTSGTVSPTPTGNASLLPYYVDMSTTTTIAAVLSATQVRMAVTAKVAGTGLICRFGSDDRPSLMAAVASLPSDGGIVALPRGRLGLSAGISFQNLNNVRITGAGKAVTTICDLSGSLPGNTAWTGLPSSPPNILSFWDCNHIELDNFGMKGSGNAARSYYNIGHGGIYVNAPAATDPSPMLDIRIHDIRTDNLQAGGIFVNGVPSIGVHIWNIQGKHTQGPLVNNGGFSGADSRIENIYSEECNSPHVEVGGKSLVLKNVQIVQTIPVGSIEAIQVGVCDSAVIDNIIVKGTTNGAAIKVFVSYNGVAGFVNASISNVIATDNVGMTGDGGTDTAYGAIIIDCTNTGGAAPGPTGKITIGQGCVIGNNGNAATGMACAAVVLAGKFLTSEVFIDGMIVYPGPANLTTIGVKILEDVPVANKIHVGAGNHFDGIAQPVCGIIRPAYNAWAKSRASDTDTPTRNLSGIVNISGAATTASVTFSPAEDDKLYSVGLTVVDSAGAPATKSAKANTLATTGFGIALDAAPAGVTAVDVHWTARRPTFAVPGVSDVALTANLLARYNFDVGNVTKDGSNNISVVNDIVGGANMTNVTAGKALWIPASTGINTIASAVGSFTGLSVYQTAANLALGNFTIHALTATTVLDAYLWVYGAVSGIQASLRMGYQIANVFKTVPSTVTQQVLGIPQLYQETVWSVHTTTYDGTAIKFYRNGVLQPSYIQLAGAPGSNVEALKFALGGDPVTAGTRAYSGMVRELRVYSAVQDSTQLKRTADFLRNVAAL